MAKNLTKGEAYVRSTHAASAYRDLQRIRDYLKRSHNPRLLLAVRRALKSAEGARRYSSDRFYAGRYAT